MSALKHPLLKTGEYDLWSMRMEQYLTLTNHALWELDNEDLEQIDADHLKEMDLKWQVAMLTMRVKRFIKKTGRKLDLNGKETENRNKDAPRRNTLVDTSTTNALVVQDELGGYDWSFQAEEDLINFAPMAYTSQGYQMRLESLEAKIVVHEKNEAVYEESIAFLKYDVQVKDISIKEIKNQLENALKEKDDLKLKLEKFETSFKNLNKMINSQISDKDKTGLGYNGQMNESEVLNNVVDSVSDSSESDEDDNQVNDMFKKSEGYHAVSHPYTRNYMPPRADLSFAELDDSVFKFKVSETTTSVPKIKTNASQTSKDSLEKPKTVRSSTSLIEDLESDSEDNNVFKPKEVKTQSNLALKRLKLLMLGTQLLKMKAKLKNRKFSQSPRVLTKSGQVPINTAKQSSHRAAVSVKSARDVNTATPRPEVNDALPKIYYYFKAHSPDQRIFDRRCSRHMTKNKSYLTDNQEIDGGFVAFEGNAKKDKITRKGKILTRKLDFKDVYFVKKLKFNLFSVSQMRDKKNNVLFTDTECVVLSPDFKLLDESQVMLKVPRNNNMYSFDLKKDETFEILKNFITGIENQIDQKVKTIRSDNGTEFKNRIMNEFYEMKGIMREFSVARTPQQNGITERKNRTLIEAARTMLADSKLPTTFWTEAVNTACYVQNKVLVIKPHNKTPYELFLGYSIHSKACRVFNTRTKIVKENLHINFLENKPNVNGVQDLAKQSDKDGQEKDVRDQEEALKRQFVQEFERLSGQGEDDNTNSANRLNTVSSLVNTATLPNADLPTDPLMPDLEDTADLYDTGIFSGAYDDKVEGAEANFNNLELTIAVSPIPTTRIHKDHPKEKIIGDPLLAPQTRRMTKISQEHTMMSSIGELTFFLGLQFMQRDDGIFISQDKYVADILKKFDFSLVKTASTLMETNKALLKDEEDKDMDVHLYRSLIGSLMYLTTSRPDIMFVVCACARFQVTPKVSHLHAVKRIFRYLKGQPKLGLWYPRYSPFDLEAFSNSDYAGTSLDKKSTTEGCQLLGKRLIS
nr:uncharacterized mitochondrial protein AtMg00810-like [Tanacetum cinerariifolium]